MEPRAENAPQGESRDTSPLQSASHGKPILRRVLEELGLVALVSSPLDIKLLILQRFVRLFAYGMSSLVLIPYLNELGFGLGRVGLFQTLTLIFNVFISWALTTIADGIGRRITLAVGAIMLCGSGVAFSLSSNFWILLAAAVLGIITPSGNEVGPFRAVEESTISWLLPKSERSDIFAWYSLIGIGGMALGTVTSGAVMDTLEHKHEWSTLQAQRGIFAIYASLGILKFILAILLSRRCEIVKEPEALHAETTPLLAETSPRPNGVTHTTKSKSRFSILPPISHESVHIVVKLSLLFALESFGSSLISLQWTEFFFMDKFKLPFHTVGWIFFTTSIIASVSVLVASSLARRFGNVRTMVFTHLPSSILLALIPFPSMLPLTLTILFLRSLTQSMDVAPRSAFLAAILKPDERTAINGFINVVKTASGAGAPTVTGLLVSHGYYWVVFVVAGALKSAYDIGILINFSTTESDREEEERR